MSKTITLTVTKPTQTPILQTQPVQKIEELKLRPWQEPWGARARDILMKYHGYCDTSEMGAGKTCLALWLAKQFNFRIMVVCPKTVKSGWVNKAALYGVEIVKDTEGKPFVHTYEKLASTKGNQPKHGFLTRIDHKTEGGIEQVSFGTTEKYRNILDQGVLLVLDEIHKIKNATLGYKACSVLMECLIGRGGTSRYALIGGTPLDDVPQAVHRLRLIGFIQSPRLYFPDPTTGALRLEGLQELINVCNNMDLMKTQEIVATHSPIRKTKINKLCHDLYCQVVKKTIIGAMVRPQEEGVFDIKNGFYKIDPIHQKKYEKAIADLVTATGYDEATGEIKPMPANGLGLLTKSLVAIENVSAPDMARVTTKILQTVAGSKVILGVNYTTSIVELAKFLIMYSPIIFYGDTKEKDREILVHKFNTDPKCRVFIMNTKVGGVGIDLHDTVGNAPRYMLLSPSYHMIDIAQATYRINRDGAIGPRVVRMFYGKGFGKTQSNILTKLSMRSGFTKEGLDPAVAAVIKLPCDYQNEEEQ